MTGKREPLWRAIAATIRQDIAEARHAPGTQLPTEARYAARFDVNRHTIRRALAALAEEGVVHARRGAGVFVAQRPSDYPLGPRVRFHQNMQALGRMPERRGLSFETRTALADEARALELAPGAAVHVYDGLSLSDGIAIAAFRSVFPAARFPQIGAALAADASVTRALLAGGVADYTRRSTRMNAVIADAAQAHLLALPQGSALLRTVSVNVDPDGVPVEYGTAWFAGERITMTLDFADQPS